MVHVAAFCIDRYEDHLVARAPDGHPSLHPYFERPVEGALYEAHSDAGAYPQAYVSRLESEAACARVGKRLCSMHEWQRACEGARAAIYSYGDRALPGQCNTDKPHLLSLRFGWDPRRWHYDDFNDPSLDREPGFLLKSGELAACASDEGVHDLVGNLHEWVSDTVDAALVARLEGDGASRAYQPWHSGNGVFMGGFFSTHGEHGPGCKFTTIAHEPGYHDYSTGLRCCREAGVARSAYRSAISYLATEAGAAGGEERRVMSERLLRAQGLEAVASDLPKKAEELGTHVTTGCARPRELDRRPAVLGEVDRAGARAAGGRGGSPRGHG